MTSPLTRLIDRWLGRYHPGRTGKLPLPATAPVVLITGASEGIGLALAHCFAASQCRLLLIARRPEPLSSAAQAVQRAHGGQPVWLALDVTADDAIAQIEQTLATHNLHVDVLVNNAGIGLAGPFVDAATADIERLHGLNIAALTRLTRHFLPAMLARGTGGVLNLASLGGLTPGPFQAVYYASKAYVISLTRAIRAETKGQGVRIAVVVPGPVETRFHALMGADAAYYRRFLRQPSAEFVARIAYRGFRLGRTMIVPGVGWSLLALSMKLAPVAVSVAVVRWLLRPR
jgi:uncharacterized protein